MNGTNLKLLPISIPQFLSRYGGTPTDYLDYLIANKYNHHYNGLSMQEWYEQELNNYLKDNK